MKITKSVYNICVLLSIAGLTLCSPISLMAAMEAQTQTAATTQTANPAAITPATPHLFELLEKVIAGKATAPEMREVLSNIILEISPLINEAQEAGDKEVHAALSQERDKAQAILGNQEATLAELQTALDSLIAVMAPILMGATQQSPIAGTQQRETNAPKTENEIALDASLKQLRTLDNMLGELAQVVENNAVKVENKRDHLAKLKELRSVIFRIENKAYTSIDPTTLLSIAMLTKAVIAHIDSALNNGFKELPAFNLDQAITRTPKKEVSLEELYQALEENDEIIKEVTQKATNAGLLWYNKLYRIFDHYIVQKGQKYKLLHSDFPWLGSRAKMLALGTAAAGVLLYIAHSEDDKENSWVTKRFGYKPRLELNKDIDRLYHDPSKEEIAAGKENLGKDLRKKIEFTIRKRPLGPHDGKWGLPIGWLDKTLQQTNPILFATFPLFWTMASKEVTAGQEWINKKCHKLANKLKGGAFLNQKVSGINKTIPKVALKDLVGLDHVKEKLIPYVNYFMNPEQCERSKSAPSRFLLFTGPTRTGKTHSAEALAGSIMQSFKEAGRNEDDFNFFVLQASSIASSNSTVSDLLKIAEEFAPCIIFIDEIDLLQLQRAGGNSQRLSEFLTGMSGALSERDLSKPVILMAATNHPENLDVALRQPGRFQEIRFEYPAYQDRLSLLRQRLEPLIPNMEELDLEKLARETEGASYAALDALVCGGFQNARLNSERLAQHHLEQALDTEVRLIIMRDGYPLSAQERQLLAVHQAGHALATVLLNGNLQLAATSIRPYLSELKEKAVWDRFTEEKEKAQKKIEHGKTYTYHAEETHGFMNSQELLDECKVHLAGHAAEKILFGECGYSYHKDDSALADKLLEPIVTKGRDIKEFPDEMKAQFKKQISELCAQCEQEITELLAAYKPALIAVAQALEMKQSLSCKEVMQIAVNAQKTHTAKHASINAENEPETTNTNPEQAPVIATTDSEAQANSAESVPAA